MDTQREDRQNPLQANRLIEEKSPYLLQHAYNPVDWYAWHEDTFLQAKKEDKPIFLSIGYSTCHWCHVMAHESFEDEEVAALINDVFIPIKVDREERPDIDNIYMTVCQLTTGSGGWPLSIFMTPDKKPFYAATYIPKQSRYNRTGLLDLIPRIKELWQNERETLMGDADRIIDALKTSSTSTGEGELEITVLDRAFQQLRASFDEDYGGFGSAPKFPIPHQLVFLLHYWQKTGNQQALQMVEKTLQTMRAGGIYDQLGYGFHRYSTDRKWLLPHFEKMLYDQATLLYTFSDAYQATNKQIYADIVNELVTYIKRVMTSPEGGFYSAEDADSEGEEGKFYVWKKQEILDLLKEKGEDFCSLYQIKEEGNFRDESSGKQTGMNILHLDPFTGDDESGEDKHGGQDKLDLNLQFLNIPDIAAERKLLFEEREKRVHPHKDDKILADWNGLLIAALARAARVFDQPDYLEMAENAVNFIFNKMSKDEIHLYHRYREDEASIDAHLDDYSFVTWGLIELYLATFNIDYLARAVKLQQVLLKDFWDDKQGGFFFTSSRGEVLLTRQKEIYDGALPSGNSIVMWNLVRLAHLTGEQSLEEYAVTMSRVFASTVKQSPSAYCQFLIGFNALNGPIFDLVITGRRLDSHFSQMLTALRKTYQPNLVVLFKPVDQIEAEKVISLAPYSADYQSQNKMATAYVCKNYSCELPTTDINKMLELLNQ